MIWNKSRKGPVQEPTWRCCSLRQVAVKPRAEEPESKSAFVLDAEIIPRRAAVFAPPGSFDPFRTFGCDHFVQCAPPSKTQGRSIRHFRHGLDRLRPRQQPQRTRRKIGLLAILTERIPAHIAIDDLRGEASLCQFGNMTVLRRQPAYATRVQARAQAVDQTTKLGRIFLASDADLFGRAGFGDNDR